MWSGADLAGLSGQCSRFVTATERGRTDEFECQPLNERSLRCSSRNFKLDSRR